MWNTLLLGVHIPEIDVLIEGRVFNVIDGKQRLITIYKIVKDQIPLYKSFASEELYWLFEVFDKKTKKKKILNRLYFSELPEEIKSYILYSELLVTTYTDYGQKEQIMLFKKINNGKQVSNYAKGICAHFMIRKECTIPISKHPFFKNDMSEDMEAAIVRYMILSYKKQAVDLVAKNLVNYYNVWNDADLRNYSVLKVNSTLDKLYNALPDAKNKIKEKCKSWKTVLSVFLWFIEQHPEINEKTIQHLILSENGICKLHSGLGSKMDAREINNHYQRIKEMFEKFSEEQ